MIVLIKGGLWSENRVDFFLIFDWRCGKHKRWGFGDYQWYLRHVNGRPAFLLQPDLLCDSTPWPRSGQSRTSVNFIGRAFPVCCSLRRCGVFGNLAGIVHVWQEVSCNSGGHYAECATRVVLWNNTICTMSQHCFTFKLNRFTKYLFHL